jgi:hypothetical protein
MPNAPVHDASSIVFFPLAPVVFNDGGLFRLGMLFRLGKRGLFLGKGPFPFWGGFFVWERGLFLFWKRAFFFLERGLFLFVGKASQGGREWGEANASLDGGGGL